MKKCFSVHVLSIHDASWCAGPCWFTLPTRLQITVQRCNAANTWHLHCSSTHEKQNILRTWGWRWQHSWQLVTLDQVCALEVPPPSPLHTHTHTHTKEKSNRMLGSKNWMLNMLSKTHFDNYTWCKRRKIMRLTQTTNMDYKNNNRGTQKYMVVLVESHQHQKARKCED
jgi:hypothetical protein